MARLDKFGLPASVRVRVREHCCGSLELDPISDRTKAALIRSADGVETDGTVFIQSDFEVQEFLRDFPRARFGRRDRETGAYEINDGAVIAIDSWTLRHMIGGQSD